MQWFRQALRCRGRASAERERAERAAERATAERAKAERAERVLAAERERADRVERASAERSEFRFMVGAAATCMAAAVVGVAAVHVVVRA